MPLTRRPRPVHFVTLEDSPTPLQGRTYKDIHQLVNHSL